MSHGLHAVGSRRLAGVAAAVLVSVAAACANQGPPPGGRPDLEPPLVLGITPEANATVPKVGSVELKFDEVISETPKGSQNLSDLVFISPKSGTPRVSWGRTKIEIKPSKGWKPNTVYSLQIKPGLVDLRGNSIDTIIRLVFSTGGPIPDTRVQGVVFDWGEGKGLGGAVVEAIAEDSTTYQTVADAQGRYDLKHVPAGNYTMRAFGDKNSNRDLDPLEIWDRTPITIMQNTAAEFYTFQHDTVGLRIAELALLDSNRTIKVTFDKPYHPTQQFPNGSVRVRNKDSVQLSIKLLQTEAQKVLFDSLKVKQRTDSIERIARAKRDSLPPAARARADSLDKVRVADSIANAERQKRQAERAAAQAAAQAARQRGGRGATPPPRDTLPTPKMNREPVYKTLYIQLDSALPYQQQFRVDVSGVRSLSDVVKAPFRTISTPKAPKVDSTAAGRGRPPADSGKPPAAPGRPPRS